MPPLIPTTTPFFLLSGGTRMFALRPQALPERQGRRVKLPLGGSRSGRQSCLMESPQEPMARAHAPCEWRAIKEPQAHAGGKCQPGRLQQQRRWRRPRSGQERAVVPRQQAQASRGQAYELLQVLEQRAFGRRSLIALPAQKGRRSAVRSEEAEGMFPVRHAGVSATTSLCDL